MEKARRTYKAERTACAENRSVYFLGILRFGRDKQISDPLAGKRKGLAEGVAYDGIVIVGGKIRDLDVSVYQFPVRLIGKEEDFVSIPRLGIIKNTAKTSDGVLRQNDAGRIVGRIDAPWFFR